MAVNENQMPRGLSQVLYRYLPLSWIDFYKRDVRASYNAWVAHWNSTRLDGINEDRLLSRVNDRVIEFGKYEGFDLPMSTANYDVMTPKTGMNAGVLAEVSPLTFFCGRCYKVYGYRTSQQFLRALSRRKCAVPGCDGDLKQLQLVYVCSCGWAGPVEPIRCRVEPADGINFLRLKPKFQFVCQKHPSHVIEIRRTCPNCGSLLHPRNALDIGNYIPLSITVIDLVRSAHERLISSEGDGPRAIIANYLGSLDSEQLDRIAEQGVRSLGDDALQQRIAQVTALFVDTMKVSADQARRFAEEFVKKEMNSDLVTAVLDDVRHRLTSTDGGVLREIATQLLEYDRVARRAQITTVDDAIEASRLLNTNANPDVYKESVKRFGFSNIQACEDIPFVICSYGFTRRETEPGKVTLRGFPPEQLSKKNVYAAKLTTEGVLFELDRRRVIEWLLNNGMVDSVVDNVPTDLNDESSLKMWFLNQVKCRAITTFRPVDENTHRTTAYVYRLVHSLCHALLRQAAGICGLDKNSLSEYIFPSIPAFLVYCQNSQGLTIGALRNLFEAYLDRWLTSTLETLETCVFDPICLDRDRACSGCLYLGEVSCTHFNKDLDRRLIIGWRDWSTTHRIYGYWEGL